MRHSTPVKPGIYAKVVLYDEFGELYRIPKTEIKKADTQINDFLEMKIGRRLRGGAE